MKKTNFKNRLLSYSLAAGAVMASGATATAEIIYTDIPDETISNETFAIDINGGGNDVLIQQAFAVFSGSFSVFTYDTNPVLTAGNNYIQALNSSFEIGGSTSVSNFDFYGNFKGNLLCITGDANWTDAEYKYFGVRLENGSDYYYAWVGLEINTTTFDVVVTGYAYENVAGVPITAGETGLSVSVRDEQKDKTTIYGFDRQVRIKSQNGKGGNVTVYDLTGKQVHTSSFKGTDSTVKVDRSGIYMVKVTIDGKTTTRKVSL